jgi:hypothetical protein
MIKFASLLLLVDNFSLFTVAGAAVAGFVVGYLVKIAIIAKQKRQILKLEDEMLANHSRILSLEKKISELETGKKSQGNGNTGPRQVELKAS